MNYTKLVHFNVRRKKVNRSLAGNILMLLFLLLCAIFSVLPMIYSVVTAFKPFDELWRYPPSLVWVDNPTTQNFTDMILLMQESWIPFSRYIFNTVFITATGTILHVVFASMCAFPLAKRDYPGKNAFLALVMLALMFNTSVTTIPNYLTMAKLNWIDTFWCVIVPAIGSPLGLYLMRQFMLQIPDAILEAAKVDGAGEWRIFWQIVMPQVKPAWLTMMIFPIQSLWNMQSSSYIYSEELKTLPYALGQITNGGIARAGVSAAATIIIMSVPMIMFILAQSSIIETMASSGIKE